MHFLKKLLPTRQKFSQEATSAVADLDAILSQPVGFILHGKMHVIKPLSVEQFLVLSAALVDIYALQKKESVNPQELIDKYYALISPICSTIKRADIENMTQQQVAALFELVMNTITGKIFVEKKKTLTTQN